MKKYLSTTKANSRRTSSRRPVYVAIGLFATGLLFFWLLPQALGLVASTIFAPYNYVESWFINSSAALPSYFRDRDSLINKQLELEHELASKQNLEDRVSVLEKENSLMQSLQSDEDRIVTTVVMRPSYLPYDVLLIGEGKESGVQVGAPVYVGGDQPVGFVVAAYKNMSLVILATSPGYESTVYIFGPDIYTTAIGEGGGVLRVSVPQGIPLEVGNEVVIPAFESGVFGSVSYIESVPSEPEQHGYVSMDIPLSSIRYVAVGREVMTPISFSEAKEVVSHIRQELLTVPVPEGVLIDRPTSTATTTVATSTEQAEVSDTTNAEE